MVKPMGEPSDNRRRLPSVERLLAHGELQSAVEAHGRQAVVDAVRSTLAAAREGVARGDDVPPTAALIADALERAATAVRGTLFPVINATGVIVHTNLGRAPLSHAAREAMDHAGQGYVNLEYDLDAGSRGSRYVHAEALLRDLTGAEAALVVNNNAGAVFLVLSALARGREVVISRGQLVEIGGGFRIPDVLRQSGARLVEVGTTNRTHPRDFKEAIGPETALLLRVHSSNFKQIGFTAEVSLEELVSLGHGAGVLVVDDLGSGTLIDTSRYGLAPEPMVQQSVAAGADLVTFSGDKLLGGPQAGLIVGRADLVRELRQHPLTRAARTSRPWPRSRRRCCTTCAARPSARSRSGAWCPRLTRCWPSAQPTWPRSCAAATSATVVPSEGRSAAARCPGDVAGHLGALAVPAPDDVAARLREGSPAVVARIADGRLLLDLRTVQPDEDEVLLRAVQHALDKLQA